ncbi:MAG: hypothetical protein JO153_04870 [Solirubrobacterales bacterium]|nr:hypothetical protein [Solirubrobacterales bacterium]MBV9915816.1 hypothetical protein [Solirubrobacterales bacterium]
MRVDVHQHIWTQPLLDHLSRRRTLPLVERNHGLVVLHSACERPYVIDVDAEAPDRRGALMHADGLDLGIVAISSPIGIEALPRGEAVELIEAHLAGSEALPGEFARWGPIALDELDPIDVDSMLDRGCVGISLPAGALAGRDRLELVGGLLERIAAHHVPLFVHPGPAPGARTPCEPLGEPLWWRALTDYVAQMQAAWLTFAAFGRREFPELTVIFALLAGCAPLHSERLAARGGPQIELRDPLTYYETSSYGPSAIEALSRRVGERQLVYGSDRPVLEPAHSGRDRALQSSAAALFATMGAVA